MPQYTNKYAPPAPSDSGDLLAIPPEEYDFNFVFPVSLLSSDRIELRPLVPQLHAQILYDNFMRYPETQDWLPIDTQTLDDCLQNIETRRRDPTSLQYAIYTAKPGSDISPTDPADYVFAGVMSCINASYDDMCAEPGWIVIFPPFQRSHVLTHAVGTLLHHVLDMPAQGGLGLRRCQWFTTTLNEKSKNAALRLGFTFEGVLRNHRVLPKGKQGVRDGRPGDYKPGQMNRDSWLASITWGEWEAGMRAHVDSLMARR